jgi:DNA excision repair protein ERCC-2
MHGASDPSFLGIGLSSRKNLCIHPDVSREKKGKSVDARCRDLTNGSASARNREAEERGEPPVAEMCSFHEELGLLEQDALIEPGVWTLDEIKEQGKRRGTCPYFAIRRMVSQLDATHQSARTRR